MTVTLTKQIILKSVEIYLKLEKKVKREDIQKYLQGKHFDNSIVENRVRDYLKEIKVFDEQYHLTPFGNEVKESGMVNVQEEGKYQIWYTQSDSLFGNKIFFLTRQKPGYSYDKTFKNFPIDEKDHFCLTPNKEDLFRFDLKKLDQNRNGYPCIELNKNASLTIFWKWKDLESSIYTFEGRIENTNIDKNIEIDSNENLNKTIKEILPNWNSKNNRYKIQFNVITNIKDSVSLFKYSYDGKWNDFDVHINNLPIEPYNLEEAKEWRNAIFNMEIEGKYMHPDDFTGNIISINQKEGFSAYSDQLDIDIPEINQYISELDKPAQKSKRGVGFWHLTAPLDLNVGLPQQLKIDSSFQSLVKDESICFRDLAQRFGRITADKIFYYDKYVTNYHQQRKTAAFLSSFGISNICIITNKTPQDQNFNDYLAKNTMIAVEDIDSVYQQNRRDAPHDRFIIFKHGDDITVWTSTNSIDYIRFYINGEIQPNDSGKIFQSVTFTRVKFIRGKKNVLETQLENFILGR